MTLQEVLIAVVILAILSPVVHSAYTYALRVQKRRAVQEEVLIYASDYMEFVKQNILKAPEEPIPFDTLRVFRSDTLRLHRLHIPYETNGLKQEIFSILVNNDTLVKISHLIPDSPKDQLWQQ